MKKILVSLNLAKLNPSTLRRTLLREWKDKVYTKRNAAAACLRKDL